MIGAALLVFVTNVLLGQLLDLHLLVTGVLVYLYDAWFAAQQEEAASPAGDLASLGEEIFLQSACIGCHTVRGTTAQGVLGPDLTHIGSRTTIAAGVMENNPENLARWIHDSSDVKPGSLMPPMGTSAGGTLSDEDIDAVAAYLLSLQ